MQPGRRFFATLDGIRGIAAIIVVGVHAEPLFGNWATRENGLAVDIFFILSGVVIDNAYGHRLQTGLAVRSFAKIRLIRFYPVLSALYIWFRARAPWHAARIWINHSCGLYSFSLGSGYSDPS